MTGKSRKSIPQVVLSFFEDSGEKHTYQKYDPLLQYEDGSNLYTLPAIMHFLRFLMDLSQQTEVHERQIMPACLVTIKADDVERAYIDGTANRSTEKLLASMGTELNKLTRPSDRAGRFERTFVVLLTRTMARNVRDNYAQRTAEYMRAISEVMGMPTTFSFGVASLTEHTPRDADTLLDYSEAALRAAEARADGSDMKGYASVAVYDARKMPVPE